MGFKFLPAPNKGKTVSSPHYGCCGKSVQGEHADDCQGYNPDVKR